MAFSIGSVGRATSLAALTRNPRSTRACSARADKPPLAVLPVYACGRTHPKKNHRYVRIIDGTWYGKRPSESTPENLREYHEALARIGFQEGEEVTVANIALYTLEPLQRS